jgi:hypothetical protein
VAALLCVSRSVLNRVTATGQRVLLLMSLDHRGQLAKAAFSLAKLGIREIVDQLHVRLLLV